jgi:hypothetical protein
MPELTFRESRTARRIGVDIVVSVYSRERYLVRRNADYLAIFSVKLLNVSM